MVSWSKKSKEIKEGIITGPLGKMLLSATMVLVIVGVFMIGSILTSDKEPSGVLDDGLPLKYAHKGDDWDTGGLFWDAKYGQERTKTLQAEDLVLQVTLGIMIAVI